MEDPNPTCEALNLATGKKETVHEEYCVWVQGQPYCCIVNLAPLVKAVSAHARSKPQVITTTDAVARANEALQAAWKRATRT